MSKMQRIMEVVLNKQVAGNGAGVGVAALDGRCVNVQEAIAAAATGRLAR